LCCKSIYRIHNKSIPVQQTLGGMDLVSGRRNRNRFRASRTRAREIKEIRESANETCPQAETLEKMIPIPVILHNPLLTRDFRHRNRFSAIPVIPALTPPWAKICTPSGSFFRPG
jgi:hypothetical protein